MSTIYQKAPTETVKLVDSVRRQHHPELERAEVTIDVLVADNPDADPVTVGGYPCQAKVKIVSLKDRAKGCRDAEIIIDNTRWQGMNEQQQRALIDHELHHLEVQFDGKLVLEDDLGRPKLKMRKHDWQIGWFDIIAKRNGDASPEVRQARKLWEKQSQLYFPFVNQQAVS